MRKVTSETVEAFVAGRTKRNGNTYTDGTTLELHGNVIATRNPDGSICATLAGYPTVTTRERLNGLSEELGLGRPFHQKRFNQFYGDIEIASSDTVVLVGPVEPEATVEPVVKITPADVGRKVRKRDGEVTTITDFVEDGTDDFPVLTNFQSFRTDGAWYDLRDEDPDDLVEWVS